MNSKAKFGPKKPQSDEDWMKLALKLAKRAALRGEVPVGALIVKDGELISWGSNRRESHSESLGHAECLAIHRANKKLGAWRLEGCKLYVTLEPCLMCAGAIIQARIPEVIFGATDPKAGAVESLYQTLTDQRLNHRPTISSGVLAKDCGDILVDFFRARREEKRALKKSSQGSP